MPTSLPRSFLFVPGDRPERFAKACAAGADVVIVDLEDAVAPADKAKARVAVSAWLSPAQPVLLRINAAATEWFRDDIELCARPGVAGIVLPKAERVEDIALVALHAGGVTPIYPLIETARGMGNAQEIAATPRVRRLVFGAIDFQLDLNIDGDDLELLHFRSQLVLASRIAGIDAPVDGVTVAVDDPGQLRAETLRAKRLGFGGKLCIHPRQVAPVNACFRPTAADVEWARRIIDAAAQAGGGAMAVNGAMVDRPVLLKARRILADAERDAAPARSN